MMFWNRIKTVGLLLFVASQSLAADNWCIEDPENPPCSGARGKCTINKDGSLGGFVASTAHVEREGFWPHRRNVPQLGRYVQVCDFARVEGDARIDDHAVIAARALVYGAKVYGRAEVSGLASVFDHAEVYGSAKVTDAASVHRYAKVYGNAQLSGSAQVNEAAEVYGYARVSDWTKIEDEAKVFGNATVRDSAQVSINARVHGSADISQSAKIAGRARVFENAKISGEAEVTGNTTVRGNAHVNHGVYSIGVFNTVVNHLPAFISPEAAPITRAAQLEASSVLNLEQITRTLQEDLKVIQKEQEPRDEIHLQREKLLKKLADLDADLEEIDRDLQRCCVCLDPFYVRKNLVAAQCGHLTCKECFNRLKDRGNSKCPTCRDSRFLSDYIEVQYPSELTKE